MDKKDKLYAAPKSSARGFTFDDQVAEVFPDMINRSIPGYRTIIEGTARIAEQFVQQGSNVYDLGCSLGATSLAISRVLNPAFCSIYAIDNASAMTERCARVIEQYALPNPINVSCSDVLTLDMLPSSMVCMNFTLQFIAPAERLFVLQKINRSLLKGGCLVLSEKIKHPSEHTNELLINLHHAFKRDNGYSELEISQKRAALENVMLIDTLSTHEKRLKNAGFNTVTAWFQTYNFVSILAVK